MTIQIGCGPITWRGSGQTQDEVLDDIATAGYAGAPWSAEADDATAVRKRFQRHHLEPAPAYFSADFWDLSRREEQVAQARRVAQVSRQLGVTELYVATGGSDRERPGHRTRRQAAGNVTAEDALSEQEFTQLAAGVTAVARATLEHGVRSCFHNHVGSFVETRAELEHLLDRSDPEAVFLGPDTGHLAWAGDDPVAFFREHRERILTAHIKDIGKQALEEGRQRDWDYGTYSDHGIFTELGDGVVDWDGLFGTLREGGFAGWLIVETDVTGLSSPRESAIKSRQSLRRWGL